MKKLLSLFLAIATLGLSFIFTGNTEVDESTIPWSRPKDWEGGVLGWELPVAKKLAINVLIPHA